MVDQKLIFKSTIGNSGTRSGLDRVPLVGYLNHIISELREGTIGKTDSELLASPHIFLSSIIYLTSLPILVFLDFHQAFRAVLPQLTW